MTRPQLIAEDLERIATINNLSNVFQSIASLQIARINRQAQASTGFFEELWRLYTQLRAGPKKALANQEKVTTDKQLFVAITGEGGFSGDIDHKLVDWMLSQYDPNTTDIICVGHHGAIQLAQAGVRLVQYFKLPAEDQAIELEPMTALIERYPSTTCFYQTYVSLAVQDVKRLSLQRAVQRLTTEVELDTEVISKRNYIFEPSEEGVINYLESTMLSIALAQVILESKLAQYASRFRAMSLARDKGIQTQSDLKVQYYRAKRGMADERLREVINGLRAVRRGKR